VEEPRAHAEAPASTANLGVGFDALSAPLWSHTDRVTASFDPDREGVFLERVEGPYSSQVPRDSSNTAVLAARIVAEAVGWEGAPGIRLTLWKGVPPGKGLGSSGASAAAAAKAVKRLLGARLSMEDLVWAAGHAEAASAGTPHFDNVAASITGQLTVVALVDGMLVVYGLRRPPPILVAVPQVEVPPQKTRIMRSVLPKTVRLEEAVSNWQRLAALIPALSRGDWEVAGRLIMGDRIIEPARAPHVPCYDRARKAALRAGAYAAFISGAGPSIGFLIGDRDPGPVKRAVTAAYEECGLEVEFAASQGRA